MKSYKKYVGLFLAIIQFYAVEGCHNAQHVKPTALLEISGRKKRDVGCSNCAEDVDPELSAFFTECMGRKKPGFYNSWRSVVDFVIRDSTWFAATDMDFCSGRKDSAKCWQRRTDFLLDIDSSLTGSTKLCISEYDRHIKNLYGSDFESYYITHYDSFDYTLSEGEFSRPKRSLNFDDAIALEDLKDLVPNGDRYVNESYVEDLVETKRQCPVYDIIAYGLCLARKVEEIARLPNTLYPSLEFFDVVSNNKFITEEFTSCRITTAEDNGTIVYTENCPTIEKSKFLQKEKLHEIIRKIDSCLILDYVEIVKSTSPLFGIVTNCSEEAIDETTTPEPTVSPIIPTTTETSTYAVSMPINGRIGRCQKGDHWTQFYNVDSPESGEGDIETLENIRKIYRNQICENPVAIDARTAASKKISLIRENVFLSISEGLRCFNNMQSSGKCSDYKIRFCCKIPKPDCNGNYQWTPWLNRDRPRKQEIESLEHHLAEGHACENPTEIDARIRQTARHYWKGHNIIDISPTYGLTCKRSDQPNGRNCKNYEVKFCCPMRIY